jgi:hypothetical protein
MNKGIKVFQLSKIIRLNIVSLLAWLRRANDIIELVSGMQTPQFGNEFSRVQGSEVIEISSVSCVSFQLMYDVFTYRGMFTPD